MVAKKTVVLTETVSARITSAERTALDRLCKLRAAELEQMGVPGDDSFAGWLRSMIRKEAKASGFAVEAPTLEAKRPNLPEPTRRPASDRVPLIDPSEGLNVIGSWAPE